MSDQFRSITKQASSEWLLRQLKRRTDSASSNPLVPREVVDYEVETSQIILIELAERMGIDPDYLL